MSCGNLRSLLKKKCDVMNILLEVGILATIVDSKNEDYTLGMAEKGMERNPRV